MRRNLFVFFLICFVYIPTIAHAKDTLPTVEKNAYNPMSYVLLLDYQPQGFFVSKKSAYDAAEMEKKRKACNMIQILENSKIIFSYKQHAENRSPFLPWQIEIQPGCNVIYLDMSWEGDGELALIDPDGKRISQKSFGNKYPKILTYYAHEGEDLIMLDPKPGIWKVWVLGKIKNPQLNMPRYRKAFIGEKIVPRSLKKLTFSTYWDNLYVEDATPVHLFLADKKGRLYLMDASDPQVTQELIGYNGLAMKIPHPTTGKWRLIALTLRSEIRGINFTTFNFLPIIKGSISKLELDKKNNNYLFYWRSQPATTFPKVLFLSSKNLISGKVTNIIIPLKSNPLVISATKLPVVFSYKYYISSSFGMTDEGLNEGVSVEKK